LQIRKLRSNSHLTHLPGGSLGATERGKQTLLWTHPASL